MVRIIGGSFKRRLIATPTEVGTVRPLPDRVRVSLFTMLSGHLEGQRVVDVFAGCGSFGLEALSRGADEVVMIERDPRVAGLIDENITELGVDPQRVRVARVDALGPAAIGVVPPDPHVVFFDPPYAMMTDPAARARVFEQFVQMALCLDAEGFAIIRTPWPLIDGEGEERSEVDLELDGLDGPETHVYGTTAVHWYMRGPAAAGT